MIKPPMSVVAVALDEDSWGCHWAPHSSLSCLQPNSHWAFPSRPPSLAGFDHLVPLVGPFLDAQSPPFCLACHPESKAAPHRAPCVPLVVHKGRTLRQGHVMQQFLTDSFLQNPSLSVSASLSHPAPHMFWSKNEDRFGHQSEKWSRFES